MDENICGIISERSNNINYYVGFNEGIDENIMKTCKKILNESSAFETESLASSFWEEIHDFNDKIIRTLSTSLCEHALIKIISRFSSDQIAELLHNIDHVVLTNVDFLHAVPSFAGLDSENENSQKVISVIAGMKFFTETMLKTMSRESILFLFEERGFELELSDVTRSRDFIHLLSQPPFNSDHRVFRLITCENPVLFSFFSSTCICLILRELTLNRAIGGDLIESILAHFVRCESIIITAISCITPVWLDLFGNDSIEYANMLESEIDMIKKWKWTQIWLSMASALQELNSAINDRNILIAALNARKDDVCLENILKLLKCSISLNIKNSPVLKTILSEVLFLPSPYDPALNFQSADLFKLYTQIVHQHCSTKFLMGKWSKHLVNLLTLPSDPEDLIQFKYSVRPIIRLHAPMNLLTCRFYEFGQFDFFMIPLKNLFYNSLSGSDTISLSESIVNVRSIICHVKFDIPGVIEAILESPEVTTVISKYSRALTYDQICNLLDSPTGRILLENNSDMIKRFKTLLPLLIEDYEEFNIDLNDRDLEHLLFSADPQTINDIIKSNSYIFENPIFINQIPRECLCNDPQIWQTITSRALNVDSNDHVLFDLLKISKHHSIVDDQFVGLVCRWIILMESESLSTVSFHVTRKLLEIKESERSLISQVLQRSKYAEFSVYSSFEVEHLLAFLNQKSAIISDLLMISNDNNINDMKAIQNSRKIIRNDNEFICNLIERDESIDLSTKKIWMDRAKGLLSSK